MEAIFIEIDGVAEHKRIGLGYETFHVTRTALPLAAVSGISTFHTPTDMQNAVGWTPPGVYPRYVLRIFDANVCKMLFGDCLPRGMYALVSVREHARIEQCLTSSLQTTLVNELRRMLPTVEYAELASVAK